MIAEWQHTIRALTFRIQRSRGLLQYSTSALVVRAVAVISSFAVLRWVPPGSMGVWQGLLLLQAYCSIVRLGITNALNRELPYSLGAGDSDRALRLATTAQFYSLLTGALGFGAFAITFLATDTSKAEFRIGCLSMAVVWFSTSLRSYLEATYRAKKDFSRLCYVLYFEAFIDLVTLPLVICFGFTGFALRVALSSFLVAGAMFLVRPITTSPQWHPMEFSSLLKTGLPMFISAYILTLSQECDRLILLLTDAEALGLYAPVAAVLSGMAALPAILTTYTYPQMTYALGQSRGATSIWPQCVKTMALSVAATLPIAIGGGIAAYFFMDVAFPKYSAAMPAVLIALVAGIFWSANSVRVGLYVVKSWRSLYCYMGAMLILKLVIPWLFSVTFTNPLTGLAFGGLIASIAMTAIAALITRKATFELLSPEPT